MNLEERREYYREWTKRNPGYQKKWGSDIKPVTTKHDELVKIKNKEIEMIASHRSGFLGNDEVSITI